MLEWDKNISSQNSSTHASTLACSWSGWSRLTGGGKQEEVIRNANALTHMSVSSVTSHLQRKRLVVVCELVLNTMAAKILPDSGSVFSKSSNCSSVSNPRTGKQDQDTSLPHYQHYYSSYANKQTKLDWHEVTWHEENLPKHLSNMTAKQLI